MRNTLRIYDVDTDMRTRVQKWGNSLAIRIPRPVAAEGGLTENAPVELKVVEGVLTVRTVSEHLKLDDLVDRITKANRHRATDTGGPLGEEVW